MLTALGRANRCSDTQDLITELAGNIGVPSDCLVLGNGSLDVIAAKVRAIMAQGHNVILTVHAWRVVRRCRRHLRHLLATAKLVLVKTVPP
jgi:histidinol-phosphate/aromatic aminotransferase/cobyric acid decarboxylase-like protein